MITTQWYATDTSSHCLPLQGTIDLFSSPPGNEAVSFSFIGRKGPSLLQAPTSSSITAPTDTPQATATAAAEAPKAYGVGVPSTVTFNGLTCSPLIFGPPSGAAPSGAGNTAVPLLSPQDQPQV